LLGLITQAPLKATGVKSGGFFLPFFFKKLEIYPQVWLNPADSPTTELLLMLSKHRRPVVFGMFSMLMKKRTDNYGFRNQQHC
jgi:hypothetical protein